MKKTERFYGNMAFQISEVKYRQSLWNLFRTTAPDGLEVLFPKSEVVNGQSLTQTNFHGLTLHIQMAQLCEMNSITQLKNQNIATLWTFSLIFITNTIQMD